MSRTDHSLSQRLKQGIPDGLAQSIRTGTVRWGTATAGARMKPDFLVVGAQRAGTTTLYRMLVEHPNIVRPSFQKGIGYFDLNHELGADWYQGHFPVRSFAGWRTRKAGEPMTFESSGYYLFHPLAADRIARELPAVKVIVLVRDPVERAFSAHAHELARGFETLGFEEAIEREEERTNGEAARLVADPGYVSYNHRHYSYQARGRYAEQIARYHTALGRDRVMVLDANMFFAHPNASYQELLEFLGLPVWKSTQTGVHNARPREDMPASLRRRLEASFESDDEALGALLGRELSWRT